jgi:hypothetical protein
MAQEDIATLCTKALYDWLLFAFLCRDAGYCSSALDRFGVILIKPSIKTNFSDSL